ncbi:LysR family glycine cleavage system transcriptional activator [Pseudoduganella flava]|uniref:LysR family glycine cleavage system transcriptional activator n=1 Tax=Pseudoduganella flava TaxID=871742 RepID=A0A562PZM6_9BURK|nr:LysR substrate-binding domain-containing protein [Pseudoduganella flava]QGZ38586.1 LysR family transcriptional regulator [Pseudoduganella flava]TWI49848.1 LysR family glycine cleavage system transcriptional activator [Pseudoduganella flava]
MHEERGRRLPPLGALRAFEAAARRGSFKLAAEELHVTPTAISHQIRQLEEVLEVRLFERATRAVRLTDAGARLYPALRDGFDSFEQAVEAVRRHRTRTATLSATVAFVARRLAPLAGSFRTAYPDWTLRLDASDHPVDLDADADAAIRLGPGSGAGLVTEPLFQDRYALVCSPRLGIAGPADLRDAPLIHYDWGIRDDPLAPLWRDWFARAGIAPREGGLSFTDEIHAVQATLAGQGVALLSVHLVADELALGALVQPFGPVLDGHYYQLVYSARQRDRAAVGVLREWVMACFRGAARAQS